ncbi:hypothetical protein B0H12DRAFT_1256144 [Mycena haematopus]|nr:hypothetical protein B0H12DRAFT_1256144 [Mycena haematopus]
MSSPLAKRQRTETEPIIRSELWVSDGNVVLQAGNTQFRVHWGVLARNSAVFRDLQGLPQPPEQPTVEGCPVIELFDDAKDVEYILNALYSPTFHIQKELPLPVVGALIRLGHKYDSKDLLDSGVARLTAQYPTSLAKYDDAFEIRIPWCDGMDFDVIALASENNILSALPGAFYRAVELNALNTLFEGIPREDGTRASLSQSDLRRCVIARQQLLLKQFEPEYTFGWARKWEFDDCTSPEACGTTREEILKVFMGDAEIWALHRPIILAFYMLCAACTRHATQSMTAGREKMWQELPEIFDLPPWGELENDDDLTS